MGENSDESNNLKKSGQIIKMLDQVQDTISECQRSCHKMDETRTREFADRLLQEHKNLIMQEQQTMPDHLQADSVAAVAAAAVASAIAHAKALDTAQVRARALKKAAEDNWVPNKFQEMSLCQQLGKTQPCIESADSISGSESAIAIGNGKSPCSYVSVVNSKSGYSTEEDGFISMNTAASTSSVVGLYPFSNSHSCKRSASDSDNNSLAVEFSDEERNQRPELPSTSDEAKVEDTFDKSDVPKRDDRSSTVNRRRSSQSRLNRINSNRNLKEISRTSPEKPPIHTRRTRKTKWHNYKGESSDASSSTNYYHGSCSKNFDSHSQFNRNNSRAGFIKAPRLSNYSNLNTSESVTSGNHHGSSTLANTVTDSNQQDIAYKYIQPTHVPMYNNIPIFSAVGPEMWPVGPIYIPANPHMFIAFGQPHQQPIAHFLHQYSQQPPLSSPQMASMPSSMPTSTDKEKVIGQSIAPKPTTSKQSTDPINYPELSWVKKLNCPTTQTGPDGKPMKFKVKRPPLPDWMAVAIENCDSALVEFKASRMASRELVYRKLVEEEYEYQRSLE